MEGFYGGGEDSWRAIEPRRRKEENIHRNNIIRNKTSKKRISNFKSSYLNHVVIIIVFLF